MAQDELSGRTTTRLAPVIPLLLVRHAQSQANAGRVLVGQSQDVALTELGLQQAREAADQVAAIVAERAVVVFSSDQRRAMQTAQPIAAWLKVPLMPTVALREQFFGSMEGRRFDELHAEPQPEGLHVSQVRWGGGESLVDVQQRLLPFLHELAARHRTGASVVLVGHGNCLRVLAATVAAGPLSEIDWTPLPNAAVVPAVLDPALLRPVW